ncbi:MAG: dockerin type I repeat-containing protein, partial [Oscillospiraceae bacterium]|nr:dockerin type I repeat-containing protein [Oscillospiraceae bacterium]
ANDNETYSGVIKGYDGSTAEAYAAKYGYKFESLGAVPLKGDIDGNGAVELDDAQLALAAYTNQLARKPSGLSTAQEKAADVTGDGEVTVDDAQAILQFYTETLAHKNPTWDKILHPDKA